MKVRAVVTDVDGTLIQESGNVIDRRYYEAIRALRRLNIPVIIDSGRHIDSLRYLFEPVKDELFFICDNGAIAGTADRLVLAHTMDDEAYRGLISDCRSVPDCNTVVSTPDSAFTETGISDSFRTLLHSYRFAWEERPLQTVTGAVKVALHCDGDVGARSQGLIDKWKGTLTGVRSGEHWVDFMTPGISKAKTLSELMKKENIPGGSVIAFGDNMNDIEMIRYAGIGYAVANAAEPVRRAADRVIPPFGECGVLGVLEEVIRGGGEIQ